MPAMHRPRIPDGDRSRLVVPGSDAVGRRGRVDTASDYYDQLTQAIAERYEIDLELGRAAAECQEFFLYGTNGQRLQVSYRNRFGRRRSYSTTFEGIVPNLERRYRETDSDWAREKIGVT